MKVRTLLAAFYGVFGVLWLVLFVGVATASPTFQAQAITMAVLGVIPFFWGSACWVLDQKDLERHPSWAGRKLVWLAFGVCGGLFAIVLAQLWGAWPLVVDGVVYHVATAQSHRTIVSAMNQVRTPILGLVGAMMILMLIKSWMSYHDRKEQGFPLVH